VILCVCQVALPIDCQSVSVLLVLDPRFHPPDLLTLLVQSSSDVLAMDVNVVLDLNYCSMTILPGINTWNQQ
jgi:hypothetical protein